MLCQNDTHVFGYDLQSLIYAEWETFGALNGRYQSGLIYKGKEVQKEYTQLCVNNKYGVAVVKGWDDEWEILKIELFSGTKCFRRPKMELQYMQACEHRLFACGKSNNVLWMELDQNATFLRRSMVSARPPTPADPEVLVRNSSKKFTHVMDMDIDSSANIEIDTHIAEII